MLSDFEEKMARYAELVVKVGLNLRPGQRLLMVDASRNHGIPISVFPLVRQVAVKAYEAGASYVDVIWADDQLKLIRFKYAPRDSFNYFPDWLPGALNEHLERGDALLNITGLNPDLLIGQDPELIAIAQKTILTKLQPAAELTRRNAVNWTLVSASVPGWAAKIFPDIPQVEQEERLWEVIFNLVRLDNADPVSVWEAHIAELAARCEYFNQKTYRALHYQGPGTDLTVGIPGSQSWKGGRVMSELGISFIPNLPTEEIFTLADRNIVEGHVTATKPLSYGGQIIEDFSLQFSGGRVVNFYAKQGEPIIRKILETDEGASRLGEVALVPNSSPISQAGLMFHNTLFDENAASHFALGAAYKFTMKDGENLSDEEFAAQGGNTSLTHVDFMIGSGEMDVDGICEDGSTEPVMRAGEWAFSV